MLKGIDPILNADVLYALRAMGHGDDLVIADANFPAETMATGRLIRMDGVTSPRLLDAVLSLMPLDEFVDEPAGRIEVVGDADAVPEVCAEMQDVIGRHEPNVTLAKIDRFDFYDRARKAFAVIATGEPRLYGCVILKMGVIRP
ncbi:MAG: RbsD/FucU family protein [Geminicoccaceae bacterium]